MLNSADIDSWRERAFSGLLSAVLIVGMASTVLIVPFLLQHQMWPVALVDTVALAWTSVIWRLRHMKYKTRVLHFMAIVYFLSVSLMLTIGSPSFSYLLGPPLTAAILLGVRPAMLAMVLGAVTLVALGTSGHIVLSIPGLGTDPTVPSLIAALNYCTIGTMLTLTCNTLLKGLSQSLADVHTFATTLQANQQELHDLNADLELTSAALARLNDMVLIARDGLVQGVQQPVIFANDAYLCRTGYTRDDIIGHSVRVLQGPITDLAAEARIRAAMQAGQSCKVELTSRTRDGQVYWAEIEMVPFGRPGDRASHWVFVGRDITERRAAADAIHRLAFYDVLTGLPNRRYLMERLDAVLAPLGVAPSPCAVLYLDIDNFKNINDARGHATGDLLLQHAGQRLKRALGAKDTVARIGGDEFVVLLDGLDADPACAAREALAIATSIHATLSEPLDLDGQPYRIGASIGVALAAAEGTLAASLLREADTAMYHAKAGGRNGIQLFKTEMLVEAQQKIAMERDLAQAMLNGELSMHLQLQVDHGGAPIGAELLMRWQRADGTWTRPDLFIPVVESSGMIMSLGTWVLREACNAWLALERAGHPMTLSINVSPLQFRQPDFVQQVRTILAETGAPPQQLIFEVTEGLLIEDIEQTIMRMQAIAALGIRFSIDDFGTGYSNLAYLKKMPLYELKIDKSFMQEVPHDNNGTAIVQSILAMAKHLGLHVVAEGIESALQADYLAMHGTPDLQGFLYHRPMPLAGLIEHLDASSDALEALAACA